MALLPQLLGTAKQVNWAHAVRENAFVETGWTEAQLDVLHKVVDSTWWIANRHTFFRCKFNAPEPWQLLGGPPKPTKTSAKRGQDNLEHRQPDLMVEARKEQDNDAPRFAASVSQMPVLAQVTILALLARLYKSGSQMRRQLKLEALKVFGGYDHRDDDPRDLDAVQRILNVKD